MPQEGDNQPDSDPFVIACGRVLGLTPMHSMFRPRPNADNPFGVVWSSGVMGMCSILARSQYSNAFGKIPDWVERCHPHHAHCLLGTAHAWRRALPEERPSPVPPESGTDEYVRVIAPATSAPVLRPSAVPLESVLPKLLGSAGFMKLLRKAFGSERSLAMQSMMKDATFRGEDGTALDAFIQDGMESDSIAVWAADTCSGDIDGSEDVHPIEIQEYFGLFRVYSPEYDPEGPFLSLEDAKEYVYDNWISIENERDIRRRKRRR